MRRWLLVVAVSFGVVLALIVGLRLEEPGLAVTVGVICGIAAAVPASGALLYLFLRERQARLEAERRQRGMAWPGTPPVVILNSGQKAEMLPGRPLLTQQAAREFTIVGEEEI